MAFSKVLAAFPVLLVLALADTSLATSKVVKGKISCLDCKSDFDLSGHKVVIKCDKVKKLAMAITEEDGSFQTQLPSSLVLDSTHHHHRRRRRRHHHPICVAKLVGGPTQIYAKMSHMISKIVKSRHHDDDHELFTISTPLQFSSTCPLSEASKCVASMNQFGASKTIDFPLPAEWGLAPSSYYLPFFPIFGIP